MHIQQLHHSGVTWVNVGAPGIKELDHIGSIFPFSPSDIKECLPPSQRPKLLERRDYIFVIFQFPVYDRETRKIDSSEVDFFITQKELVMIHESKLEPVSTLFELCVHSTSSADAYLVSPAFLLSIILEHLFDSLSPMLNHLSLDIDSVEQKLFDGHNREVINEILIVKRNIANFKKIMQAHKAVIEDIVYANSDHRVVLGTSRLKLNDLIRRSKEVWESLKNYDDAINAIHDSHASLISVRQSEIIKTLTVISVLTFPLTLIAAVFAIDPSGGMPFLHERYGFWYVLAILFGVALFMLLMFKKKKWI